VCWSYSDAFGISAVAEEKADRFWRVWDAHLKTGAGKLAIDT